MPKHVGNRTLDSTPAIRIVGARTHNLRNLNVEIPAGKLTVITGVSGSGKSSLAFDTIFAEGRRRYLSSVSSQSRALLQETERPDVDLIDGLPPVLSVAQQMSGARKRSTVATASDIYDYLRILYARLGQLHCPHCGQPVVAQSRTEIVEQITRRLERQKVMVLAPILRGRTGAHSDIFARIVKDGYVRARVDGDLVDAAAPPELLKTQPHDIDIVIDRLILKPGIQSRLEESIDLALQLGHGQCVISEEVNDQWQDRLYSNHFACKSCDLSFPTIESRSFSFNSHAGACSACHGLGELPVLTETNSTDALQDSAHLRKGTQPTPSPLGRAKRKTIKTAQSHAADAADSRRICDACQGTRLGPLPRAVLVSGTNISQFCSMSPRFALERIDDWTRHFGGDVNDTSTLSHDGTTLAKRMAAQHLLPEIASRLKFLLEVGLDYLTLDRGCETLSAGELQRTRLAACLGSQLTGVCYILDEPTAGLHSSDTARLMESLVRLRNDGNTVLLVEHDLDIIRSADHVIDLGPGAGVLGGNVLAIGSPDDLRRNPDSITGQFLDARVLKRSKTPKGKSKVVAAATEPPTPSVVRLEGASLHNLQDVTIEIPLQRMVCVTGVSGSGKSSLVMQTLVPAIRRALGERHITGGPFRNLVGVDQLTRLVRIDQSPLGRSSRSTPATYSGLWDEVRWVFAKTKESRRQGFTARNFSLTIPEARCRVCAGRGEMPIDEKQFSEWRVRCSECGGRRFSPATLSILYRGRCVADVLEMSIEAAATFFQNFPRLARTLNVFNELGLGYLKLGQSASTLSGGEAQRVKLGTELSKSNGMSGPTLFVLDEPTSGLHAADIQQLLYVLRRLVSEGHSILVIEHNIEVLSKSDWQIEVGPSAGALGGQITYAGPPQ